MPRPWNACGYDRSSGGGTCDLRFDCIGGIVAAGPTRQVSVVDHGDTGVDLAILP